MQRKGLFIVLALALGLQNACATSHDVHSASHKRFLEGISSLQISDNKGYQRALKAVNGDPLKLFLEFEYLKANLNQDSDIERFLETHSNTFYAQELKRIWLFRLGSRAAHSKFLQHYKGSNKETLQCYGVVAKAQRQGYNNTVIKEATKLWLKGGSVSDACDPVFKAMYQKQLFSSDTIWDRTLLAVKKNKLSLAKYLAKKLPATQQKDVQRLLATHQKPQAQLDQAPQWENTQRNRDIIQHGIIRYARSDVAAAWQRWQNTLQSAFSFTEEQRGTINDSLVLRAAWRHQPEAVSIYQQVPAAHLSQEAREWRVRTAIRHGHWDTALLGLNDLDTSKEEWRYWQARALQETHQTESANALFRELANSTSYYGFLAADSLNQEYVFTSEPVIDLEATERVSQLKQQEAFRRIRSLFDVEMKSQAYAEWMFEIGRMNDDDKRVAARLAHEWGWHFTAIVTTARANHFSDLELRFPLLYANQIKDNAYKHNLRPSLVYGIIRRESAFKEAAVSPAGALGLMQVMPRTARMVGKKLGMKKLSKTNIKSADINIQLGTRYLREVLDTYNNHEILATASYNAGPSRVKKWLPDNVAAMDADIWVDSITFDETRKYVKAVHFYSTIFDWKSDGDVDSPLKQRMTPIYAPIVDLAASDK